MEFVPNLIPVVSKVYTFPIVFRSVDEVGSRDFVAIFATGDRPVIGGHEGFFFVGVIEGVDEFEGGIGDEITRDDFLNRARAERKSDYLKDNREEIWDELQALL